MRSFFKAIAAALTVSCVLILSACEATPTTGNANDNPGLASTADVKVSLAVVEGSRLNTSSPFHVIIQNTSNNPQKHFDEFNPWGYGNISLQWSDSYGRSGTVTKIPIVWNGTLPKLTVLQPGDCLVRDITFDPDLWQGWPTFLGPIPLKLKVVYESTGKPKIKESSGGWVGEVESKELDVTVEPPMGP